MRIVDDVLSPDNSAKSSSDAMGAHHSDVVQETQPSQVPCTFYSSRVRDPPARVAASCTDACDKPQIKNKDGMRGSVLKSRGMNQIDKIWLPRRSLVGARF